MDISSSKADGAPPSGVHQPVFRPAGQVFGRLSAATAAVLALSLIGRAQPPADLAGPMKAAARAVRPMISPEGLAGPAAGALAPDSTAVLKALLKKAGLRSTIDPHRLSWDQARKVNALLPADSSTAGFAKPFHLDIKTRDGRQALDCLTQAAYFEAGGNGPQAQAGVVQVVLNRVRHPDFPKSVCGVVYQGAELHTGCQFTFTCDGALKRGIDGAAWDEARRVAERALAGYVDRAVGTATYYHADYVFPTWAPSLVKMATVGPHIFYRMAGREGAAAYLTGQYAGQELKLVRAVLRANDKRTQKTGPEAEPRLEQAAMPAGLKSEASRLQRVKAEIAAATPKADDTPVVETASLAGSIQTTLQAAAPPPIVLPPVAPASTPAAPAGAADVPPAA
jgi:spore germination cell wall hydrolase CwlJ-like protein